MLYSEEKKDWIMVVWQGKEKYLNIFKKPYECFNDKIALLKSGFESNRRATYFANCLIIWVIFCTAFSILQTELAAVPAAMVA